MFGEQATEIIYRGLRIGTLDWVYGYLIVRKYRCFIATYDALDFMVVSKNQATLNLVEVAPETLCAYTLKTDKNDIKVFVGDILEAKMKTPNNDSSVFRVIVMFDEDAGIFANGPYVVEPYEFCFCEVIGNIINNPELLDEIEFSSCD